MSKLLPAPGICMTAPQGFAVALQPGLTTAPCHRTPKNVDFPTDRTTLPPSSKSEDVLRPWKRDSCLRGLPYLVKASCNGLPRGAVREATFFSFPFGAGSAGGGLFLFRWGFLSMT